MKDVFIQMQMQLERLPGIHALTITRCKVKPKWKRNQEEFFETDKLTKQDMPSVGCCREFDRPVLLEYNAKIFPNLKKKAILVGEDCSGGSSDEGTAFVYPLHQTIDYFLPATNNPLLSLIFFVFVCPLQMRLDFPPE